ncbi:hypothetical protein [Pseudofrankia sp. BMG5.37]|uniref:hypothetical protein n=1 Tax=Pseudofrankia sp. BMG5.37 TaxID=3050035 RepID=UPI002894DEA0|nr:hypothetical protein [Pseudofrankia sp. BMG5.37]MDT3438361.1 hypothetical protein [Pseudofrankia sp. BMG5.37]
MATTDPPPGASLPDRAGARPPRRPESRLPRPVGRHARIELSDCEIAVFAPYSNDLRDAMRSLGAHWSPAHWSVDRTHMAEALELVGELHPTTVVDARGAA